MLPAVNPSSSQSSETRSVHQSISWLGVLAAGIGLGAVGFWSSWSWLVSAGIAPIMLALAPCLLMYGAMCAANLCLRPRQSKPSVSAEDNETTLASDCHPLPRNGPRENA